MDKALSGKSYPVPVTGLVLFAIFFLSITCINLCQKLHWYGCDFTDKVKYLNLFLKLSQSYTILAFLSAVVLTEHQIRRSNIYNLEIIFHVSPNKHIL